MTILYNELLNCIWKNNFNQKLLKLFCISKDMPVYKEYLSGDLNIFLFLVL